MRTKELMPNHRSTPHSAFSLALIALFLGLAMASISLGATPNRVSLEEMDGKIRVLIDEQLFTEYRYKGYAKPILYPVFGPQQLPMTRSYPLRTDIAEEAKDHPHHKSMWFTHGSVNGINFWEEIKDSGKIVHDQLLLVEENTHEATIRATNTWLDGQGKEVCRDQTTLVFTASSRYRTIDWLTELSANSREIVFGDTKEGTMGIRMHPNLRLDNTAQKGGSIPNGQAENSVGVRGRDVWGKRAEWIDYWGTIQGQVIGIAIFDHPRNPRHPTWWHARDYGLVAANPFGIHDFEGNQRERATSPFRKVSL